MKRNGMTEKELNNIIFMLESKEPESILLAIGLLKSDPIYERVRLKSILLNNFSGNYKVQECVNICKSGAKRGICVMAVLTLIDFLKHAKIFY